MATPFEYSVNEQVKLIGTWEDFLAAANDAANPLHDAAVKALLALNKRNYDKLPPGAPKGALTEAQVGAQRRAAFTTAAANYASHTQELSANEVTFNKVVVPAREFLRETHRTVAAIARDEDVAALAGLPLLGEVSVPVKMFGSATTLIAFLKKKPVLAALVKYNLTAQEIADGEAQIATAYTAWKALDSAKGAKPLVSRQMVKTRDEAVSWLAKWWNLARGVLADQPEILKLLGVVETSVRKSTGGAKMAEAPTEPAG